MKYFVIFLVLIGFTGSVFGQYLGDKFPPDTMFNEKTGEYVFPPSYVDFYYSDSRFEKYSVITEQYRYDIPYMISNGNISQMNMDCSNVELVLFVEPSGKQGWITLALPRQLIDSKMGSNQDDDFFVLLDSKEITHPDIVSEKLRLLLVPFSNDTSQVNIIGVNYPEHIGANACNGKHEPPFSFLFSPLKQFKSGILIDEIKCKDGFVIAIKNSNGNPACVKLETKQKLIERGWTKSLNEVVKPEPEAAPISESDLVQKQKQQQAKLHAQEVILTDYRGNEHQINAINEYRNEFEPGYFLEQFILFPTKQNFEKDDLINFVFIEWGYQSQECTSPKVDVYFRPYENYDSIEKISEWQKLKEECHSIDFDSNGYLIVNIWPMPGMPEAYQTCIIPGEYRIVTSNLNDESKKELGYFTCQKEKLVGEPQPWMELPE